MSLIVNEPYDDSGHEDPGHPERPDRSTAAMAAVTDLHLGSDLIIATTRAATRAELIRVHNGNYLDELGAFCYGGGGDIDQDTYATLDSWSIAVLAAGGGLPLSKNCNDGAKVLASWWPGHQVTMLSPIARWDSAC